MFKLSGDMRTMSFLRVVSFFVLGYTGCVYATLNLLTGMIDKNVLVCFFASLIMTFMSIFSLVYLSNDESKKYTFSGSFLKLFALDLFLLITSFFTTSIILLFHFMILFYIFNKFYNLVFSEVLTTDEKIKSQK